MFRTSKKIRSVFPTYSTRERFFSSGVNNGYVGSQCQSHLSNIIQDRTDEESLKTKADKYKLHHGARNGFSTRSRHEVPHNNFITTVYTSSNVSGGNRGGYQTFVDVTKRSIFTGSNKNDKPALLVTEKSNSDKSYSGSILSHSEKFVKSKSSSGSSIFSNSESDLQKYCKKVYGSVGKLLGVTIGSSVATLVVGYNVITLTPTLLASPFLGTVAFGTWAFCFGGSLYQAFQIGKPEKSDEEKMNHSYKMHAFVGVTLAPSLLLHPQAIPAATVATIALTAGPVMMAYKTPSKSLLPYGTAMYTCLTGLIGVGLASVIAPALGYHSLGMAMHNLDLYGGVALFTLYNAYDTHVMLDDYEKGNRDVVLHATNYSLNVINLFVRLLQILDKNKNKV